MSNLPRSDPNPSTCWELTGGGWKWWHSGITIQSARGFNFWSSIAVRRFTLQCILQVIIWCTTVENSSSWWGWKGCFLSWSFWTFLHPSFKFFIIIKLNCFTQFCLKKVQTVRKMNRNSKQKLHFKLEQNIKPNLS